MPAIEPQILDILANAVCEGNLLKLQGQLDRKTYLAVNKVIEALGGQWSRGQDGHVMPDDAAAIIEPVILTGTYEAPQDFGYFPTPEPVVKRLLEIAQVEFGHRALEPSAGSGNIAIALAKIVGANLQAYELQPSLIDQLESNLANEIENLLPEVAEGQDPPPLSGEILNLEAFANADEAVAQADFLEVEPDPIYDRIVMNPPFSRQQDIDHVLHAAEFLAPGGRLTAVMSAGVMFRTNTKTVEFRDFVNAMGEQTFEALPDNSFQESGTNVNTVIVSFVKPLPVEAEEEQEIDFPDYVINEEAA